VLEAGLLAGASFLVVRLLFVAEPIWAPLQLAAAPVVGSRATASFDWQVMALGLTLHFAVALAAATLLDVMVRRLQLAPAIVIGAITGLMGYVVVFHVIGAGIPALIAARGGVSLLASMILGMVATGGYEGLEEEHSRARLARAQ
jgi:hypothetical protein